MGRLSQYNSKYHDDWGWSLAIKGAIDDDIAEAFGITARTLFRWYRDHETLREAVQEGKTIANARVERSLYNRAIGITTEDTESSVVMDANGNPTPVKVRTYRKKHPPDTMAIIYWLNNRERNAWSRRNDAAGTDGSNFDSGEVTIFEVPDNGRDAKENNS